MAAGTIKGAESPRVFISYARSDGEQFATDLRKRLLKEHIPLWQDRVGMEGGRGWWQQITEALDQVEFMVEDLPADFVPRIQEFDALIDTVLGTQKPYP